MSDPESGGLRVTCRQGTETVVAILPLDLPTSGIHALGSIRIMRVRICLVLCYRQIPQVKCEIWAHEAYVGHLWAQAGGDQMTPKGRKTKQSDARSAAASVSQDLKGYASKLA
jgi:hypothetical protein